MVVYPRNIAILVRGIRNVSCGRAFLAVFVDLAATVRARPAAPQHLARRLGPADHREPCTAARTVDAADGTYPPAATDSRLPQEKYNANCNEYDDDESSI